MTVKELSGLYYLNLEIERAQKTLKELEDQMGPASPALSGMPHSPNRAASKTEQLAVAIADLHSHIAARRARCIQERDRLEQYIQAIPDPFTRSIFELRFAECLSWEQVADRIGGGNATGSVKKRCYRYLKAAERQGDRQLYEAERRTDEYERGERDRP